MSSVPMSLEWISRGGFDGFSQKLEGQRERSHLELVHRVASRGGLLFRNRATAFKSD